MKYITVFLLTVLIVSYSSRSWAATCGMCFVIISKGENYCGECKPPRLESRPKPSRDTSGIDSREEQVISTPRPSENLPGTESREALVIADVSPGIDIEVANILLQDGRMYKKSLCFFRKKSKLLSAITRFKMIINDYTESDKADDAAYELARIYKGFYFKDYAGAAYYYVTCYQLNPNTDKPASYMAAKIYDLKLRDYASAIHNYELTLKTCRIERYRKKAGSRLNELRNQGF
jgi:TolA-binding protein